MRWLCCHSGESQQAAETCRQEPCGAQSWEYQSCPRQEQLHELCGLRSGQAGKQVHWKGHPGTGRHQVECEPARCLLGKAGWQRHGLHQKECSCQAKGNDDFTLVSTSETTPVELCLILDTVVQEGPGTLQLIQLRAVNRIRIRTSVTLREAESEDCLPQRRGGLFTNTWEESVERTEPDSFQWYPGNRQESRGTDGNTRNQMEM